MYFQVVEKWGDSFTLRIPKELAQKAHLKEGTDVGISVSEGRLVVALEPKKYNLEELLAGVTPENLHTEVNTGSSVGCEAW